MSTPAPLEWEQRPDESDAAYRAFCAYRDQEAGGRRLLDAYRLRYGKPTANTIPGYFAAWSSQHSWIRRAGAYDQHIERRDRLEREQVWATRAASVADTEWDLSQQLIARAREMLTYPLVEQTLDRDGQTVVVKPTRWKQADARAAIETASKLQRLATGQPTDRQALTGGDGGPLAVDALPDLSGLTDDQLAQLRELLALARATRDRGERSDH